MGWSIIFTPNIFVVYIQTQMIYEYTLWTMKMIDSLKHSWLINCPSWILALVLPHILRIQYFFPHYEKIWLFLYYPQHNTQSSFSSYNKSKLKYLNVDRLIILLSMYFDVYIHFFMRRIQKFAQMSNKLPLLMQ